MVIHHNLVAANAERMYGLTNTKKSKSTEKLSSGYRINRSADDAAGLAISEKMRRQIRGLNQGSENIQDGISYVQVADGALNEIHDMLHRLTELSIKASNGTLQDTDRDYIDSEFQSIKDEMSRVFETTTFNDKKIWYDDPENRIQIASEYNQAAKYKSGYNYVNINDSNSHLLTNNGNYKVNADDSGVKLSWTDFNSNAHTTKLISWDDIEANNYRFNAKDYFDPADTELFKDGTPVFDIPVSLTVDPLATRSEIALALNNTSIYQGISISSSAQFENKDTAAHASSSLVTGTYISFNNYRNLLSFQDNNLFTFDHGIDAFIEPTGSPTNLSAGMASEDDSTPIEFTFQLAGTGEMLTASCTGLSYTCYDMSPEKINRTWEHYTYYEHGLPKIGNQYINHHISSGSMAGIKDALTGDESDTGSYGILSPAEGGYGNGRGSISLNFNLNNSSGNIGSMYINLSINGDPSVTNVYNELSNFFNNNNLDIFTSDSNATSTRMYTFAGGVNSSLVEIPIYKSVDTLWIHTGPESDLRFSLNYDYLNKYTLGIATTNTRSEDDALQSLDKIKNAMQIVSEQRSTFGAYQNRLEHALANNNNIAENTQAAESIIRDTDMAKEMVQNSTLNILEQAGISMMAQANQTTQSVLALLQ